MSEPVDAAFPLHRRDSLQYIVVAAIAMTPLLVLQLSVPEVRTAGAAVGGMMGGGLCTCYKAGRL